MSVYAAISFTYNEQPSATKWNLIGTNFDYIQGALCPVGSQVNLWGNAASVGSAYWLVANGQTVSDSESPINGLVLPNMNNVYVRNVTSGNVRTTLPFGGADTINLTHGHTVNSHSHVWATSNGSADVTSGDGQFVHGNDQTAATSGVAFSKNWSYNTTFSTGGSAPNTDNRLSATQSILPTYVSLIPIIRIK